MSNEISITVSMFHFVATLQCNFKVKNILTRVSELLGKRTVRYRYCPMKIQS